MYNPPTAYRAARSDGTRSVAQCRATGFATARTATPAPRIRQSLAPDDLLRQEGRSLEDDFAGQRRLAISWRIEVSTP